MSLPKIRPTTIALGVVAVLVALRDVRAGGDASDDRASARARRARTRRGP